MYSEMGIEALVLVREEKTFLMMNGSLWLVSVFGGIFCMIDYGQWKGFHFAVGLSVTRSRTSVLGLTYVV